MAGIYTVQHAIPYNFEAFSQSLGGFAKLTSVNENFMITCARTSLVSTNIFVKLTFANTNDFLASKYVLYGIWHAYTVYYNCMSYIVGSSLSKRNGWRLRNHSIRRGEINWRNTISNLWTIKESTSSK